MGLFGASEQGEVVISLKNKALFLIVVCWFMPFIAIDQLYIYSGES
jgi:hypothetical protein